MRQTRRIRKNRKRKSRGGAWPWSASTPENDANEIVKLSQNLSKENVQKTSNYLNTRTEDWSNQVIKLTSKTIFILIFK